MKPFLLASTILLSAPFAHAQVCLSTGCTLFSSTAAQAAAAATASATVATVSPVGSQTTVSSSLGISTLAALVAKPAYSLMGTSPVGNYHALPILATMASGATTVQEYLTFTTSAAAATAYVPIATRGWGDVRPNMPCQGTGIASGTTILAVNPQDSVLVLSAAPSASLASGATFTCGFNLSGIVVGSKVTAGQSVEPSGGTVTAVTNTAGLETLTLSKATTGSLNQGEYLEYYSPFTDAQVASMTMDFLNTQSALANIAVSGGRLQSQAGTYNMGALGIVIPSTSKILINTPSGVDWVGQGESNTYLSWATDPGFGAYYVTGAFRLSDNIGNKGVLSDLFINGHDNGSAPGHDAGNATVLGWPQHRRVERVGLSHGYGCMAFSGDQTSLRNIDMDSCYYGLHYDANDSFGDFGDQSFTNVSMSNMGMAGIACGPLTNCGNGAVWTRSGIFTAPYGVFKETNTISQNVMFNGFEADDLQMEGIEGAGYSDDQPATAPVAQDINVVLRENEMYWGSGSNALPLTASTKSVRRAYIQAQYLTGTIDTPREVGLLAPGAYGIFDITYADVDVTGDWDQIINNVGGATSPYINAIWPSNAQPQSPNWRLHAHGWDGIPCNKCFVNPGYIVAAQTSGSIGIAQGTATEYVLGASKYYGGATNYGIVAVHGVVPLMLSGATTNYNEPVKTGSNGVVQATGGNDVTSPIVGNALSGATSSGNSVSVSLKPTQ